MGITDRYILYKRSTPSTKRLRSIEINGRSHTVSTSVVPWGGTWGGQDNNLVSYSSWSAPSGNWPNVVITLADGTVTPAALPDTPGTKQTVNTSITLDLQGPLALGSPSDIVWAESSTPFTRIMNTASGGDGNFTYAMENLVSGMTFEPISRELRITSDVAVGRYTLRYKVTDGNGQTVTRSFTADIRESLVPPVRLPAVPPIELETGTGTQTVALPAAERGVIPYTYEVTGLPAGVSYIPGSNSLNINRAAIQVGTYTATYKVTDNATPPDSATRTISITAVAPPSLYLPPVATRQITQGTNTNFNLPAGTGRREPVHLRSHRRAFRCYL